MSFFTVPELEKLEGECLERIIYYIHLITAHSFDDAKVTAVLEDTLNLSGKMIRPKLLLLCGALGHRWREKSEQLCMLAAMVELVHIASLIHDDIIDNAPYRRGKPSIQSKYGKKAAVYAGDFIIARIHYYAAIKKVNEAAAVLSKTIEAMCNGEIGQAVCSYREDVTIQDYFLNIQGKTSALFKASCMIGASESGCPSTAIKKLETFGENFGYMFQLKDDLLDFTSSGGEQGKKTHSDFRNGVYTFPVLMAMQHPDGYEAIRPIMHANAQRMLTDKEIAEMEEAVVRFGGIEATYEKIREFACANRAILNELEQHSAVVTVLEEMLKQLEM